MQIVYLSDTTLSIYTLVTALLSRDQNVVDKVKLIVKRRHIFAFD